MLVRTGAGRVRCHKKRRHGLQGNRREEKGWHDEGGDGLSRIDVWRILSMSPLYTISVIQHYNVFQQ
jgi:hypothetical protein